jgi:hypothetical protein
MCLLDQNTRRGGSHAKTAKVELRLSPNDRVSAVDVAKNFSLGPAQFHDRNSREQVEEE